MEKSFECDDTISREDTTKHIKDRLYETACNNTTYQCYADEVFADIAEHRIETWINEIPSVTQKSETVTEFADRCRECGARYGKLLEQKSKEWILVSKKLPDDGQRVLTTIQIPGREPKVRSGEYYNHHFANDNGDYWNETDIEVTAWMPLPKAYNERRENDPN